MFEALKKLLTKKNKDILILAGIALAAGISLLNVPAYAPALNIHDALDDILRLLLVLGGLAFLIKKIQNKWDWSNRQLIGLLGLILSGAVVIARCLPACLSGSIGSFF